MDLRDALDSLRRRVADLFAASAPESDGFAFAPGELDAQLATHRSGLFLGLFNEETTARAFEQAGVLPAIRARVGAGLRLHVLPEEGIVRAYRDDRQEGPEALVLELKGHCEQAPMGSLLIEVAIGAKARRSGEGRAKRVRNARRVGERALIDDGRSEARLRASRRAARSGRSVRSADPDPR